MLWDALPLVNLSNKLNFQVIPPLEADSSSADQANSHSLLNQRVPITVYNNPKQALSCAGLMQ